jgi:endonuclease YncB( thermonuclease family)
VAETDRFDRTLANIYVDHDGQLLNVSLWLPEQGWARTFTSYTTVETDRAEALVAQAQAAHRGIWSNCTMSTAYPEVSG